MSRIVVLGGGESGVGSAVLAKVKGFDVFLSDMGNITEEYRSVLQEWNIPFEQGKHTEDLILNADEVIKSPGIPPTAAMVKKIVDRGINVISEIEFAGRYDSAKKVCKIYVSKVFSVGSCLNTGKHDFSTAAES
jgi:UDP-N-acetylmuramoylalanine--D-glutamate ligase